jgi:hypothetical protein
MAVSLTLHLFGKPGYEIEEGTEVTAQQLRDLGQSLQARLQEAADVLEKLTGAGWEAQMGLYDVFLSHPYMDTAAQVEEKLEALGIDPEKVSIDEWPDEEDEEAELD